MPKDTNAKALEDLQRQAKSNRSRLEPDWFLNLAMFDNKQWLAWDGRQLYKPQMRRNRITITDNRITGAVNMEVAKMTKQRPVFTVAPSSEDQADTNAAMMAEQIMRYLWGHLHMQELSIKALRWSRICGSGFFKVLWDSTTGPSRQVITANGKVMTDAQGAPLDPEHIDPQSLQHAMPDAQISAKTVSQGDVKVEVRSPFQMFIDPLADSFPEAEWLIEESIKSTEYVLKRYGVKVEADTSANPGLIEARMGGSLISSSSYKGVKVKEYWCRPNSDHPDGYRCVWVKDKILLQDDKPFDPFPYVMLSGIPVPGRIWPMSIVDLLRGPQVELNKIKSQIAENRNRVGNPTILASKQAVQDPEKFIDSMTIPGGTYFFDDVGSPNTIPQYLQAPNLPEYVIASIASTEESMQDISGQHDVSSAQTPPGVTAASAINLLQEADDTRLGPAITDWETQLGKLGKKLLAHVSMFYSDARSVALAGDNGTWERFDFRGAMLRGNTQVSVQAGSAFPQSKAAKQAWIQDMLTFFVQSGNPPHGRQLAQVLRDVEVGGMERFVEQSSLDETQVNRENVLMAQGQAVPLNDYDDDEAHIQGHTDWQKSARYAQLPPPIQQLAEAHVAAHRERLAQQQEMAQQQRMAAQGQPPPEQAQQGQQLALAGQQQEMAAQQAQAQGQVAGQAQQQGYQAASQEQQQRHAEESHHQKMTHAQQLHEARLRQTQTQNQGGPNARPKQ